MKENEAQTLALSALGFMAGEEGVLERLIQETGTTADQLRAEVLKPELLGAVLDFLFADEVLLLAFCRREQLAPDRVIRARAALPGAIDWM